MQIKSEFTNYSKDSHAQGTIEYLVVLGIIIIIGLIVVGMMASIFDSKEIVVKNNELKNRVGTGGISILEAILDSDGTAIVTIKNNTSDTLTITSIFGGNVTSSFDTPQPGFGKLNFYLKDLNSFCQCSEEIKEQICLFNITRRNKYGNTETIQFSIPFICVNNSIPKEPIVGKGSGTLTDPFIINSAQELQNINQNLTAHYKLGADINMSGITFTPIGFVDLAIEEHSNIETEYADKKFTGTFNGNGKILSNLTINYPNNYLIGLFSYNDGNIYNLTLSDANINGYFEVGAIAGYNSGNINNVTVSGRINATQYPPWSYSRLGGITGWNKTNGTITLTTNNATITGTGDDVGGISGITSGNVSFSKNSGIITGRYHVGGISGYNSSPAVGVIGAISSCYNTGTISGNGSVGGITGSSAHESTISNTYNLGTISGYGVGGITGLLASYAVISASYNAGNIIGTRAGGINGNTLLGFGSAINSFNVGLVNTTTNQGGLDGGTLAPTLTGSYWDTTLSGQTYCFGTSTCSDHYTTNTPEYYYSVSNPPLSTWDTDVWQFNDNNYPTLKNMPN
jgi:hypothetical protein